MGYVENFKAHHILDLDSNIIVESRDVEFLENKFYNDSISSQIQGESTISNLDFLVPNKRKEQDSPIEPRRSQRIRKKSLTRIHYKKIDYYHR